MSQDSGLGGDFRPMPPPAPEQPERQGPPPPLVKVIAILLCVNLALSIVVTILSAVDQHALVRLMLKQTHHALSDQQAHHSVVIQVWTRAVANIVVGLVYLFLITRLNRGRRSAWRRLAWLSVAGSLGIVYLLIQPYPAPFKAEQVVQLLVLIGLAICVLHPTTRAYYAKRPKTAT